MRDDLKRVVSGCLQTCDILILRMFKSFFLVLELPHSAFEFCTSTSSASSASSASYVLLLVRSLRYSLVLMRGKSLIRK